MRHPILGQRRALYFYFSFWSFILFVHLIVLKFSQDLTWQQSVSDGVIFNFVYSSLALSFWYTCKYSSLTSLKILKLVEHHLFAATFSSLIWLGISYFILSGLFKDDEIYIAFLKSSMVWRGLIGILFYFLTISLYYIYIYSMNFREQLLKETELKALIKEAELRSLKFQINPHFIFNSLNSINSLTVTDPEKAGEMTIKLADYLRLTLSKNEQQKSKLKEELDSVKLYLDIEKVRFGDKIRFGENVDKECLNKTIPSMLLQPLFENAVKHGVYESLESVNIRLICSLNENFLKIQLENQFDPEVVSQKGEGIGLKNIADRLERIYGNANLLKIEKDGTLFRVKIFIPYMEASS